mgnify:CR=1 FL=1
MTLTSLESWRSEERRGVRPLEGKALRPGTGGDDRAGGRTGRIAGGRALLKPGEFMESEWVPRGAYARRCRDVRRWREGMKTC